jgi:hypothetical protein
VEPQLLRVSLGKLGFFWKELQVSRNHACGTLPPITIRSLLFALRKTGVLTDLELKQLDVA